MRTHKKSVKRSNFNHNLSEGKKYEAQATELATHNGWYVSAYGTNLAALHRPDVPQLIGPNGLAVNAPDLQLQHSSTGIRFDAEVKKKPTVTASADCPYYPLDYFRMDYASDWQKITQRPVIFIFWNEQHDWQCASVDKLMSHDPVMVNMPKSTGDPNKTSNGTHCYKLETKWFQPLTTLLNIENLRTETKTSFYANGQPI
jgi:hypothetical protein